MMFFQYCFITLHNGFGGKGLFEERGGGGTWENEMRSGVNESKLESIKKTVQYALCVYTYRYSGGVDMHAHYNLWFIRGNGFFFVKLQ